MRNDKIIKFELDDYITYDKINDLAIEYTVSSDYLINLAIKRLINDVEFVRELRNRNIITHLHHQDEQK